MRITLVGSVVSLALAACSSSSSDPAQFEQATDQQLNRVMTSAMSLDALLLTFAAQGYAGLTDSAESCPRISTEGNRRHVVGGCATEDGRIDGEMYLENVPSILDGQSDPTKPSIIEANDFVMSGGEGGDIRFDGTMTIHGTSFEVSLDSEVFGIAVQTEAKMACPEGVCTYESASIDVDGLGSATVKGSFSFASGDVDLQVIGKDTLTIATDGNCVAWSVGSRGARQCNDHGSSSALGLLELARDANALQAQRR